MCPPGFEPAIPSSAWQQTHTLDKRPLGIGKEEEEQRGGGGEEEEGGEGGEEK